MSAQQNPFAELMAQFAAQQALQAQAPPEDYSDPEAQRREAEIWAKINRGPRERADELTAKGWKDRYGIDEKSGKLSRVFAGLGEAGRAISQRNNPKFQGIADEAVDRGMKEYQVEVGPLQRELGVLSQSRTAAARFQSQAKTAANAQKIKLIDVLSDAGLDNAKIAKTLGTTEQEVEKTKKIRAETGNIEQRTSDLGKRGALTGDAGNAFVQSGMSPEQQSGVNSVLFGNAEAKSMGNLMGNPKRFERETPGTPRTSTTMRDVPSGVGPGEIQLFTRRPSTTTSTGAPRKTIDNTKLNDAVSQFQQRMGVVSQQVEQEEPIVFHNPAGEPVQFKKKNTPERTEITVENGRVVARSKLDPILKETLSPYFPDVDWNHSEAVPRNYTNIARVTPAKKGLTAQEEIAQSSIDTGQRLARNGVQQYISGDLGNVAGIVGGIKGAAARMFGKSSTGQTMINADTKRLFAEYSLAMTGKSSNPTEKQRYENIMPTTSDNEITFMQKALTGAVLTSQTNWLNGLNLKGPVRDKLMTNPMILDSPKLITDRAFQHMEAAKAAKKIGSGKYRVGDKEYETAESHDFVWSMLSNTSKLMQDAFWETYPDGNGLAPPKSAAKIK